MKVRVLWLGKTKNPHLAAVCGSFVERARHLIKLEVSEVREPHLADENRRIEIEGRRLLEALGSGDFVVALDPSGPSYTSEEFAAFLNRHMVEDPRDMVFGVGGHAGLSDTIRRRADRLWSLSPLTYSHDLARAILLEQIYRALTIIHNHPYAR